MTLHSAPDPSSTGVAIEAKGLEKAFGEVPAVRGLNLNVSKGESLGLLGPNGAGKTTTLRILSTLLPADGGSVRVLGLDPAKDGRALRARIGVVPQDIALYTGLRAEENLRLFGELAGLGGARLRERVEWGLETAGLEERRRSLVSEFSGGMKRRLNLVAALLHEPELVFLDEPTAGVDPQSRNHLFEQVEAIHRAGTTLVYTTHAMGEVERLCDRIVIMDRGRRLAEGTLEGLRDLDAVRAGLGTGLEVEPGVDLEQAAAVLREHGMGAEVRGEAADLESIFLALTGRALRDENVEDAS